MTSSQSNNKFISEIRERVLLLLTKGLKGYQIASHLEVDPATISRDIHYLSKESNNNLNSLVEETLPFMYQTSIEGIKTVLNECWNIFNNNDADKEVTWMNKLNALKLARVP